jgi:hypothetical protein
MPLPPPVERDHLHTRQILCQGYRRGDGLWDIEARLVDTKSYGFPNIDRGGRIEAGEPIHDMSLRVTLDLDLHIHEIAATSDDTPYTVCGHGAGVMERLKGLRIGPGWMREVRRQVGGDQGCTHLIELLAPLATTAYQTLHGEMVKRAREQPLQERPKILDTCHALSSSGPVVLREWPEFYTGPLAEEEDEPT